MRKFIIGAAYAIFAVASINASAALVSADWKTTGDNLITRDKGTGLEWLDLTETVDMSLNNVLAETGFGGMLGGWQIADNALVTELWTNAGIPNISFTFYEENYDPVNDLLDLLGTTYTDPVEVDYRLSWGRTSNSYSIGEHNVTLLWERTWTSGIPEAMAAINTNPQQQPNDLPSPTMGTYLYRETVVPIPAAVWLFSTGLIGLIGLARRKKH